MEDSHDLSYFEREERKNSWTQGETLSTDKENNYENVSQEC